MKKHLSTVLGATALGLVTMAATPAAAQIEGLSANAAVTTNYIFRGISQSGANPAVQAGLDYAVGDTGLAFGTWASSIDFGSFGPTEDAAPFEWDIYGSYTFNVTDMFALSAGADRRQSRDVVRESIRPIGFENAWIVRGESPRRIRISSCRPSRTCRQAGSPITW